MRKVIAWLVFMSLFFTSVCTAAETEKYAVSSHKLKMNGATVLAKQYLIDGQNYVNINDIAFLYDRFAENNNGKIVLAVQPENVYSEFESVDYFGIESYSVGDINSHYYWNLKQMSINNHWFEFRENRYGDYTPIPVCDYYPQFSARGTLASLSKACIFYTNVFEGKPAHSYIPKAAYERFMFSLLTEYPFEDKSSVDVCADGTEREAICKIIDGELYCTVRSLADIFGYEVSFDAEADTVQLTDLRLPQNEPIGNAKIYYINGIRFLKSNEIEDILSQKGYVGEFTYNITDGFCGMAYGYFLMTQEERQKPFNEINPFGGSYVPYINNTDNLEEAQSLDHIYFMYDYFKNKGILD